MLYLLRDLSESLADLLKDDPVRPHIPYVERLGSNKDVFVLQAEDKTALAITCVSYQQHIPASEAELFEYVAEPNCAVFYTIWSYKPGAGRQLINDAVQYIQANKPHITRYVTLSPQTETARRFHIKNGASIFRQNEDSVNYEYLSGG
jgi:hypothetical protein